MSNVFEKIDTIRSWDDDYYHPIAERFYDRAVAKMLQLMEVPEGETVLDAGCGPGVHSVRAARMGYKVNAIDISRSMLDTACQRVASAGLSASVSFRQEDLTQLSIETNSIRYAFSWGVIIHIREVENALNELTRIVTPGGKLALYVTNNGALDQKLESVARLLLRKRLQDRQNFKLGSGIWYNMHGERLWVWQFNIPELIRQMEQRGFVIEHRKAGEFSELQRRFPPLIRAPLLHVNNLYNAAGLTARLAIGNLLVFRSVK